MARGIYYGGYFGSIGGIINPCNPFWGTADETWKIVAQEEAEKLARQIREREEAEANRPQYEKYILRLLAVIRKARHDAKTDREFYELDELDYYYSKRLHRFIDNNWF